MSPGVIGSTVLPHVYDAKSVPGSSSTRVGVALRVEVLRRLRPVRGHVLGPLEVLAVEGAVEERRQVHDDEHDRRAPITARAEHRVPAPAQRPRPRR